MLPFARVVTVALLLASGLQAAISGETVSGQELAVDVLLEDGQRVQFPFYDSNIKKVSPIVSIILTRDMKAFNSFLVPVVDRELDNPGSTGYFEWLKVAKHLIAMSFMQFKEIYKLMDPFPRANDFKEDLGKMFTGFIAQSKNTTLTIPDETPQQLKQKFHKYLDTIQICLAKSPVSVYVDLRGGKINGIPFDQLTIDLMASFRKNGFDKFFKAIEKVLRVANIFL